MPDSTATNAASYTTRWDTIRRVENGVVTLFRIDHSASDENSPF